MLQQPYELILCTNPQGLLITDGLARKPLNRSDNGGGLGTTIPLPGLVGFVVGSTTSNLTLNLAVATVCLSYLVKYGSLGLDAPFLADPFLPVSIILAIPAATAYSYYVQSKRERGNEESNPPSKNLFPTASQQQLPDNESKRVEQLERCYSTDAEFSELVTWTGQVVLGNEDTGKNSDTT